jgi:hypothetical protein
MTASPLAAVATVAVAVALLLAAGPSAPRAGTRQPAHAPTHYSAPFAGLFPARDVWGQYERSN